MAKLDGTCWEGRTWVACDPALDCGPVKKSFRLLSYNVLSDYKTSFLHYTTTKNWDIRSKCLLDEINTYNADIICLQDADHYQDWWRPQLTVLGYDTVYKQRTQTKNFHYEGVMIAFRRDVFQLFKSQPFELNNAVMNEDRGRAFKERSKTDDVGVIVFLQPWSKDCVNSAVCVCCTMLSDEVGNADIRMVQTNYVARQIELANMEFHVPVILACSMFDTPSSLSYTVMCTGRIPLAGQVPKRCLPPTGFATCRGSVLLKWLPPASSLADYPILCYRISWRPGGSQVLAFRAQIEVSVGDCVKYAERMDENRNIRMVALDERQFTIAGLVSDVPYEFRVVAVNEVGEGVWSDVSRPVVMDNPERAPEMPELRQFANIVQLKENIELSKMQQDDRDAYVTKRIDAMSAQTQLTPRNLDGDVNLQVARSRVLPYELNPRTGWKEALKGTPDGRIAEALNKESIISKSVLRDHSGFKKKELNHYVDVDPPEESYNTQYDRNHSQESHGGASPTKLSLPKLALETARIRDRNAVLLDGKEVLDAIGVPNKRQAHDLMLSSAYTSYGAGGEPLFTATMPSEKNKIGTECMDYVFYSNGILHVDKVLSIPLLSELRRGERAQASCAKEDVPYIKPYHLAEGSFDAPIQKLNQQLGIPNPPNLLGPSSSEGIGAQVPRDTIVDAKRLLRSALEKSRVAGNQPLPPGTYEKHAKIDTSQTIKNSAVSTKKQRFDADTDGTEEDKDNNGEDNDPNEENIGPPPVPVLPVKTTPSGLWGGKWAGIPTYNHQRTNFWLPSETYASSHIALGVEFSINDQLLCTYWS